MRSPFGRLREAEILAVLLEDVAQAAGQRPDVGGDAEAEADRVAGRRVRILADDQHADVVERLLEGREDARRVRQERRGSRRAPPRRKSPSWAITSLTGASASAQPGPTLSASERVEAPRCSRLRS